MQKRPPHGENLTLPLMLVCIVLQDFKAARIGLQSLLQTVKCQYQSLKIWIELEISLRYAVLHMFTQVLFWAGKVISKISTHPCYPWNFDWFSWEWSKKIFFWIVFFKMANLKKLRFQNFLRKFLRLVLGLVGLNDAKGIEMVQPIWSSGCPA